MHKCTSASLEPRLLSTFGQLNAEVIDTIWVVKLNYCVVTIDGSYVCHYFGVIILVMWFTSVHIYKECINWHLFSQMPSKMLHHPFFDILQVITELLNMGIYEQSPTIIFVCCWIILLQDANISIYPSLYLSRGFWMWQIAFFKLLEVWIFFIFFQTSFIYPNSIYRFFKF